MYFVGCGAGAVRIAGLAGSAGTDARPTGSAGEGLILVHRTVCRAGRPIDPKSVFFAKKDQKKFILSVRTKKGLIKKEKIAENVYFTERILKS